MKSAYLAGVFLLASAACSAEAPMDDDFGEGGEPAGEGGGGGDEGGEAGEGGTIPEEPRFRADVWPYIQRECSTACHPGDQDPPDFRDAARAYGSLVEQISTCDDRPYVKRGDPEGSYLLAKLESRPDICGGRMPRSGPFPPQHVLDTIRLWIEQGAAR